MVKVARGGLTLGQLVGVPDKTDPAEYAASLVAAAQGGGAKVMRGKGYAIDPALERPEDRASACAAATRS